MPRPDILEIPYLCAIPEKLYVWKDGDANTCIGICPPYGYLVTEYIPQRQGKAVVTTTVTLTDEETIA